ncbi:peptide chain release factor N(5)-glutamine methyltransferase [Imbroritus primus]|uniref:Peptide chain release factor N(5)-glutamine methyltransferase n=1 Tax=Imbroritus primus TaxID=3058603 RepID=A0ACD3SS95_9BURK|nr:peptide chain release factor N(5)-glutamine methyltransferase [Burkholderiaceae bacterium PBA]
MPALPPPPDAPCTISTLLQYAVKAGLPALEARMLLTFCSGLSRTALITQDQTTPSEAVRTAFLQRVARRQQGEPMAYLLGEREFFGRMFAVSPAVLIPRPDTETLVEWSLDVLRDEETPAVLELGTGSGIIAVTIALERPDAHVLATDVSAAALAVARQNAADLSADNTTFATSDWYAAIEPKARYQLIVSNPPYIAADDSHLREGDLRFEPAGALTDHACGLSALRTIVSGAPARLAPGGWLLVEHGYDQGEAVRGLFQAAGFAEVTTRRDLAGQERCTGGYWPGNTASAGPA